MTSLHKWNYPTEIHFGDKVLQQLVALLPDTTDSIFIITDPYLKDSALLGALHEQCESASIRMTVHAETKGEPSDKDVLSLKKAYQEASASHIIALGGGSVLDVAKALALFANYEGSLWDLEDGSSVIDTLDKSHIAPLYAIPTTAGTGSELGRVAVITDSLKLQKRFIFHPDLTPCKVLYAPSVTVTLPKYLTATTGLDAFTHNFEGFCVNTYHPIADSLALEGMRLIKDNLEIAFETPNDINARGDLLVASGMGAMAFQKGLGAIHALSHPVGARYHVHHGLLNAIMLPHVIKFNQEVLQEKYKRIEYHLNLKTDLLSWVLEWFKVLQLPVALNDVTKIPAEDIDTLCQEALLDPSASGNPVKMTLENTRALLVNIIEGQL